MPGGWLRTGSGALLTALAGATDWGRLAALLQKAPAGKQLILVKLCPSLDETLLALWNEDDDESHRRNGKHGDVLAVVGVKMRDAMPLGRLAEHPDDDTVKA